MQRTRRSRHIRTYSLILLLAIALGLIPYGVPGGRAMGYAVGEAVTYTESTSVRIMQPGYYYVEAFGGNGGVGGLDTANGRVPSSPGGIGGVARELFYFDAGDTVYIQVGGTGGKGYRTDRDNIADNPYPGGVGGHGKWFGRGGTGGDGGTRISGGSARGGSGGGGGGASGILVNGTELSDIWLAVGGGGGSGGGCEGYTIGGAGGNAGQDGGDDPGNHNYRGEGRSPDSTIGEDGKTGENSKSGSAYSGAGGGGGGGGYDGGDGGGGISGKGGVAYPSNGRIRGGAAGGGAGGTAIFGRNQIDAWPSLFPLPNPTPADNSGKVVITYIGWLHTVRLDDSGGSGGSGSVSATDGAVLPNWVTPPTRRGYTFLGYWTTPDALPGDIQYFGNNGAPTDVPWRDAFQTLYARWTPIPYSIAYFDLLGGDNPPSNPTSYTIEDTIDFKAATRTNHQFSGWFTQQNGGEQVTGIRPGTRTGDVHLYARWSRTTVTVTEKHFDISGDSLSIPDHVTSHSIGTAYSKNAPGVAGYVPVGWCIGDYSEQPDPNAIHHIAHSGQAVTAQFNVTEGTPNTTVSFIYRRAAQPLVVYWVGMSNGESPVTLRRKEYHGFDGEDITVLRTDGDSFAPHWLPVDGAADRHTIKLSADRSQKAEFHYRPAVASALVTIIGKDTNGELYRLTRTLPIQDGSAEVAALRLTGYRVTGYTTSGGGSGDGDTVTVDPAQGDLTVTFTYEIVSVSLTIRGVENGNTDHVLFEHVITGLRAGMNYPAVAPFISDAWVLVGDRAVTVPLDSSSNTVTFSYKRGAGNLTILLREVNGAQITTFGILQEQVNEGGLDFPIPDLNKPAGGWFVPVNEGESSRFIPADDLPKTIAIDYKKVMADVILVPVDVNGTEIPGARIVQPGAARRGEIYTATAPNQIAGYLLAEPPTKLVSAPEAENLVYYRYQKQVYGQILLRHFYMDGGNKVILSESMADGMTGSTLRLTAVKDIYTDMGLVFGGTITVDGTPHLADYVDFTINKDRHVVEFEYVRRDSAMTMIKGRALLSGKHRSGTPPPGYTPDFTVMDRGIRVELFQRNGDVWKAVGGPVYTDATPMWPSGDAVNYAMSVPSALFVGGGGGSLLLRFTRIGGDREESYLCAEILLDISENTVPPDEDLVLPEVYLTAGAFVLPGAEKEQITLADISVIKSLVGGTDEELGTRIFNINEYGGTDASDYATVLRYLGNKKLAATVSLRDGKLRP